jgi:hypothetical protein
MSDNSKSAFPYHASNDDEWGYCEKGMTLRDYFAGQALTGLCSIQGDITTYAELAYLAADSMLKERKK